nr:phage tail spike protein [Streptococcus parasanguinis]
MGVVIILYLLDRNVQTVKWNGQPLHEATKAEVEEVINVSYTLKVDYPITNTEIYKKFQEDMLIIAPTPVTGRQLFRIKEISEQDDTVSLTCQHITEDIFKRSVRPIKVSNSTCQIALNAMISAVKTPLGKFSFTSNIMDNRTFNTTEDETLYKILMDGKHSIVGAWEGEMIRDNFLIDIPKSRGIDRGVVITTHQNLKQYERNKSSSSIITRLHLKSTFKPEGAEKDTVLKVTVDSPLIGKYPYINEAEYENNDLTTEEELRKWGEAKFKNGDIDKPTDQIKIEAYELDGQIVHLGDTASLMSLKHDVMLKKEAVGYVFDALSEKYISLTFDDKAGHGGGMSGSNGISDVASEILDTVQKTQEDDEYSKKLKVLVDNANRAFEDKAGALGKEITDGIEQAKAQAEVVKAEISAQITGRFNDFNLRLNTELYNQDSKISDAKKQADAAFNQMWEVHLTADKAFEKAQQASAQALYAIDNNDKVKSELADFKKSAQISQTTLSEEINAFKEQYGTKLNEVVNTTNGISTKIAEIKTYVDNDGGRIEELRRYVRDETSENITSIREELSRNYINKATYNENARTVERRFEALTSEQDAKLSTYKQGIDGRFTEITSLLNGKVNQSDFQRVRENSALYERVLGTSESDVPNKMSRLIMSSQIFQTEVGKYVTDDNNLIVNSMTMDKNTLVGNNNPKASVSVNDGIFTIKAQGLTGYNWSGFSLPIYVKKIYHGETYTLGFKYRIREYPDSSFAFNIKNHGLNKILLSSDIGKNRPPLNEWQEFQKTFTVQEDFAFGEDANYPFYIYLAKNGWVEFKEPILVRGSNTGPYKPSQFDDAFAKTKALESQMTSKIGEVSGATAEAKQLAIGAQARADQAAGISRTAQEKAEDAQTKAIQVAEQARQAQQSAEATRTQVTQLAGSYAIQNLNSAGDLISGINLGASGLNRITGRATHITGDTLIDNAVIKSAMVDKLKTGNFESGSVTTQILASNAVTADKLLVDSALINKFVSNQAFIRELTSQKAFITQLASIDFSAEHIKGGRLSAKNGSTVFDLDNGTLNLYSNTGTIRRIDDTNSSQFIKLMKSGFVAEKFRDSNAALMVFGTNHNKDPKEVERHDNKTFAGIRIWSGKGNGAEESLTEFIGDRVLIYSNNENRSPWNFHNNIDGKQTYLLPMNQNSVKHYIGRGDFFLEALYSRKVFLANGKDVGAYLWDLLTCFGMMVRHGMITNTTIKNHIQGILNGYGFRI